MDKNDIEIEVTPEMIEAGLEKLYEFDITCPVDAEMRLAVAAVFVEMLQCHGKRRVATQPPVQQE